MNSRDAKDQNDEFNKDALSIAMQRCDSLIKWYENRQKHYRSRMGNARLIVIILSGLVPVLVIIQMSLKSNTTWWLLISILIASFPAGAAIVSAWDEIFQFKENWVRCSVAVEELKSEKHKFLTRTTKNYDRSLDDYKAFANFVSRVEAITLGETRKWSIKAEQSKDWDELLKSEKQEPGK